MTISYSIYELRRDDSMDYKWIFDGIGTEIIGIVITTIIGFLGWNIYKDKSSNRYKQSQQAGNEAEQIQIGHVSDIAESNSSSKDFNVQLEQKANDNAHQIQIGGMHNGVESTKTRSRK